MTSKQALLYFSSSLYPPPFLYSPFVYSPALCTVLLSSFSLLHPLYTDQNLEFHWHTVCLSQSDTSHHGNCAEPGLHFTLHPPPSIISVLWRSQVEEGGDEGEGRYQINPLSPAFLRHITTEGNKGTKFHYNWHPYMTLFYKYIKIQNKT